MSSSYTASNLKNQRIKPMNSYDPKVNFAHSVLISFAGAPKTSM